MSANTNLVKTAYKKENYTPEQLEQLAKCMHPITGPRYFMENFMYIQHPTKGCVKFEPFDYQIDLIDCYHNYRYSINLLSRQMGKTTVAAGYLLWYAMFVDNSTILVAAHKYTGTQEIMERIRYIYEGVPDHIRAGATSYNKHSLSFDNKSRIVAQTTTTNTGRGMSISLIYCDEFAFVEPRIAREFWTSLSPTLATGGKCIITSTPNNPDDQFADIWFKAIKTIDENGEEKQVGKNGFRSYFADWRQHPDRNEEWAAEERQKIGEERFMREHENKFVIFDETLINALALDEIKTINPIEVEGHVRWYKKINPNYTYVLALDPSMGTGGDYAAIQVLELPTLEQVAEWQNNKMKIEDQIKLLKTLTQQIHSEGATEIYWSVENNSLGEAALVVIRDTGEETFAGTMLHDNKAEGKARRKGFNTSNKNKLEACAKLKSLIEYEKLKINSKNLLHELRVFVRNGNTYEAKSGDTDDLVMAMILAIRMTLYISTWEDATFNKISSNVGKTTYDDDEEYDMPLPVLL